MSYRHPCSKFITCVRCGEVVETLLTITPKLREEYVCNGRKCFETGQNVKKARKLIDEAKKKGKDISRELKLTYKEKVVLGIIR